VTKYRINFSVLGVFCVALVSTSVFAEAQHCAFDDLRFKLEVVSCASKDSLSILKLAPSGQPSYEANLENLPTYIVSGSDLGLVLKAVGNGAQSRYNNLIELPYPEAILHYNDASAAAKLKLSETGWKLLDMKDFVYEGQGGEEGAGVVCSTLEKQMDSKYVVVSQCNAFYEADISDFKVLLGLIEEKWDRFIYD